MHKKMLLNNKEYEKNKGKCALALAFFLDDRKIVCLVSSSNSEVKLKNSGIVTIGCFTVDFLYKG